MTARLNLDSGARRNDSGARKNDRPARARRASPSDARSWSSAGPTR